MRITRRTAFTTLITSTLIYGILISISYIKIGPEQNILIPQNFNISICEEINNSNNPPFPIVEEWISKRLYDTDHGSFKNTKFDIVYTWVNGSDQRHRELRKKYRKIRDKESWYRDFDELRYSMRSIEKYFKKFINKIWIITTDYESDEMQIPSWLNKSWGNSDPRVELIKHSEIFNDVSVLPTFNSLAIESQMMNNPKLKDKIIYFNDDLFMGKYLASSDFWTPLYGFVFHIQHDLTVPLQPGNYDGEWYSLYHTNMLLSKRFGYRERGYVTHTSHVLSKTILKEISEEWAEEFHTTSSHRFRTIDPDIHTTFMFTHYVIEKHRETLLKSFLIFKNDVNHNFKWELSERQKILKSLGSGESIGNDRKTLNNYDKIIESTGIEISSELKYTWSSMDGYPYAIVLSNNSSPTDNNVHQTLNPNNHPPSKRKCKIDFKYCFGEDFMNRRIKSVDIENIFNRITYEKLECGDCIIQHIVKSSGDLGLEDFLPPPNKKSLIMEQDGIFQPNIDDNLKNYGKSQLDYRSFAISQLYKYSYVIGENSFDFILLRNFMTASIDLKRLEITKPSIFCINDNIISDLEINPIKNRFKEFMENYYKVPNEYEKTRS
ncbi:603_t:CDS:2 [Diversispora eburnea]|uniref:603_t:CDS:1 n=1 Tax=Diversispora eburnea TaxID=1213867 RepID=A0A9N9C2S7_9GLOM|nr:603_t:CDS:2 [Diversispora eburnea]